MALSNCGFVVSLEIRASAVTERADVVLPVAPPAEKAGRFVDWEGRRRPFDLTLTNTGALTDARVLDSLAAELDVVPRRRDGRRDPGRARPARRRARLGSRRRRSRRVGGAASAPTGSVVLATWAELLDDGRLSDGDENLAGTAKPARALLSAATAAGGRHRGRRHGPGRDRAAARSRCRR